jgi:hypothetical protein
MSDIVKFPASSSMNVEQALNSALQNAGELEHVLIIGVYPDEQLFIRSSRMNNADALWMIKQAELDTLGLIK